MAKVSPFHKSGPESDPANYRPISSFPLISQAFEKHINKRILPFVKKYKLIHVSQSVFFFDKNIVANGRS